MQFMPLVFTQLLKLVSLSTPKDVENIKPDILRCVRVCACVGRRLGSTDSDKNALS